MNRHFAGRNIALAAAVLFATGAARLAAADDLPKAETILDKFIDATGGKAAYQKIHNEMTTGAMTIAANGISGTLTVYHAEPDKSYTEINIEGVGKLMEGTDGKVAWSLSAIQGPHVKEGEEKADALRTGRFNGELNWRDLYKQVQTAGTESVDGKDCYKVVLTPKEGNPLTHYYDKQSSLLVKSTQTAKTAMGEFPVEQTLGEYRKEGEILLPHKVMQKAAGQEIAITIDTVKYNVDIPKDRFDVPDEIKALLNKK
ncbi:MAG: DUF620 domain-containing protein [Acidobacteriia bacterium]|nr:DUF620 domain-containing protein [Terriglobia bacterium]